MGRERESLERPQFFVLSGSGNSQENQQGAVQPNHIFVS